MSWTRGVVGLATIAVVVVTGCAGGPDEPQQEAKPFAVDDGNVGPEILDPKHCENAYNSCVNLNADGDPADVAYWTCVCKDEYCACSRKCLGQICLYPF